jgi:hypothetical protein
MSKSLAGTTFKWVVLRFVLGIAQISLSIAGLISLWAAGFCPRTWVLLAGATAATLASRFLYRGSCMSTTVMREDSSGILNGDRH